MTDKIRRIVGIGAGGVGFYVFSAVMGDLSWDLPVEVWDNDDLGVTGNGHFRLPVANVGEKKVAHLARFISHAMGHRSIIPVDRKLTVRDLRGTDQRGTLFVDCTDMATGPRRQLIEEIRRAGGEYLRISYDGVGVVTVSPGAPFDVPDAKGGYEMMPDMDISFIAGGIGARAIRKRLEEGIIVEDQWMFPSLQRGNKEDVQNVNSNELPGSEGLPGAN